MFFSFQTPSSEYAQALVDFHHYVFFFLVIVVLFVIWMIKLSLLFVLREKNLLWASHEPHSDFYFEHNNAWFGSKGEFYYLIDRLFLRAKNVIISLLNNLQIALPFDTLFFVEADLALALYVFTFDFVYFVVGDWHLNKYYYYIDKLCNKHNNSYRLIDVLSLNYVKKNKFFYFNKNLTLNVLKLITSKDRFLKKLARISLLVGQSASSSDNDNSCFVDSYKPTEISDLSYLALLDTNSSAFDKDLVASLVAPVVISSVKKSLGSTRFSHWLWGGKNKAIFLFFSGKGDAYSFDSKFMQGFDENLQMPHAFKFFEFYNQDLFRNSFLFFQNVRHRLVLEWVWTFIPTLILLCLVVPSLYLLYTYDRPYVTAPYLTFKAIGNQWYWAYEYWDYEDSSQTGGLLSFSSNMLHEDELSVGQLRLLEVDRRLVLPAGVCIRLITTSVDVLHSWAVPAFGVKIDSVPGRLNQFWLVLNKPGVYYGQCSELCGVNHGFMPIAVEVVFLEQFLEFLLLDQ